MPKSIQHIAVIRLSAMGDVAMIVPVVRAFIEQNPSVKITIVSRLSFKPFFENLNGVNFFEVDEKNRHKGVLGLLRLYADLKHINIDAIADLHDVLRSKFLRRVFALSGKKVSFTDKGRKEKADLTREENKLFVLLKSMFERHVETFGKLGFSVDLTSPSFPEKAILTNEILKKLFKKDEIPSFDGIKIGIAPFAQYQTKVYPHDLMQQVVDELAKNINHKIFLFGGGLKEIEVLNQFSQDKNNVFVVAGKLNLEEELQLISNLNVMLSMDSGNAHIAAMLNVKVITLWGATHPYAGFSPFNQPLENCLVSDRTLYPKLPTSVYGNKIVEGYDDVMRSIAVESVLKKISKILL